MEFMAEDALPLYLEEDEEEAAAAKQKRRQQSRKPPPPPPTPEEEARKALKRAMRNKLHEYDPKLGYGCYNRVWFVDFTTFDIDEETQFGPMRFTDSLIGDNHKLTDSLNVLCLKIMSSDVGFPINVYGTVIVRDRLDMKCIYIFRRNRDNCQLVQSEGEPLILTGPSRGIVFHSDAYFEIDLKIKEEGTEDKQFCKALTDTDVGKFESNVKRKTMVNEIKEEGTVDKQFCSALTDMDIGKFESNVKRKTVVNKIEEEGTEDKQFCKTLTDMDVGTFESNVIRKTVVSWLSEVDLILAYVKNALEGTIEIKMLSGPEAFYGKLTACTTDVLTPIMLYDSDIYDTNTLGNERVIQLLRRVVAVSEDQMLRIHAYAHSGDQNANISHRFCEFTPLIKGADKAQITCGGYKLQVKVTWSTLLNE